MFDQLTTYCNTHNLIARESRVVLGLSGGPDSVFLFHFLLHLRKTHAIEIIAAHLNHEWRAGADNDEQFCEQLARMHQVTFVSRRASKLAITHKYNGSKEEQGRVLRRFFFAQILSEYQAQVVALAHHCDDQIETFFIRLIRGATLAGLSCMKPKTGYYIRPLLDVTKQDIITYLQAHRYPYCVDPSNADPTYLRNRIRMHLIPALQACDVRAYTHTLTAIGHIQQAQQQLEKHLADALEHIVVNNMLDISLLRTYDIFVQKQVLVHWIIEQQVPFTPSTAILDEIVRYLDTSNAPQHSVHPQWALARQGNFLSLITRQPEPTNTQTALQKEPS